MSRTCMHTQKPKQFRNPVRDHMTQTCDAPVVSTNQQGANMLLSDGFKITRT